MRINFGTAGFPFGVTSGTFAHTFILATDVIGIPPAEFLAGLLSNDTYVNIHTDPDGGGFPGGEIRGQLTEVPEPSTLFLLASGLAGLRGLARRRQRRT